jgi:TonB family protein
VRYSVYTSWRRSPAIVAVLTSGLVTVTCAAQPSSTTRTPPTQHESDDARWSDWMVYTTLDTCDPRLMRTEAPRPDQLRYNCVSHVMELRNESARPIQCRMHFELSEPAFSSGRRMGGDAIVYPGRTGDTYELLAPATSLPAAFSSTCQLVPQEPPPLPSASPGCTMTFEGKYLDDYYPRGAMYRKEEGVAEVDFVVDPRGKWAAERTLVASSGFESLDQRSLDVLLGARPVSNCPGQRFRGEITFGLEDKERPRVTVRWIRPASLSGG